MPLYIFLNNFNEFAILKFEKIRLRVSLHLAFKHHSSCHPDQPISFLGQSQQRQVNPISDKLNLEWITLIFKRKIQSLQFYFLVTTDRVKMVAKRYFALLLLHKNLAQPKIAASSVHLRNGTATLKANYFSVLVLTSMQFALLDSSIFNASKPYLSFSIEQVVTHEVELDY